jgi:hypothetical protein
VASRYYLSHNAPGTVYHGPLAGVWASKGTHMSPGAPVQPTYRLQSTKTDIGTMFNRTLRCNQAVAAPYDLANIRWVTPALEAQTIAGTLDLCAFVMCRWNTGVGWTSDATAVYKVHAYIAVGESATVRHTLLDNYVDGTTFHASTQTWRQLTAPQALASGACEAGDVVVVEMGFRVLTSPAHTIDYPPTEFAEIPIIHSGGNPATADGTSGSTTSTLNPWLEFSQTLTEQAAVAAPANQTCATAIAVTTLPYHSAAIDTTQATSTEDEVWWTWTPSESGQYCVHALGSNYNARIEMFSGSCGSLVFVRESPAAPHIHRSLSCCHPTVVSGTQYFIRVYNDNSSLTNYGPIGGAARLGIFGPMSTAAVENDLYIPNGLVYVLRDGAFARISDDFSTLAPTGIAFDYSSTPIDDLNGGTHAGPRVLLGLHNVDLVELLDAHTLNLDEFEIDFISDPFDEGPHIACLAVDSVNGHLYAANFGDGYHHVAGIGSLPAYLNTVASVDGSDDWQRVGVAEGDNQAGAPYTATDVSPSVEFTAPWCLTLDETLGIIYYLSGSLYVEATGQTTEGTISRWDYVNALQLADLATLTLNTATNVVPGLRGLVAIPGQGVLVCNGAVVQRVNLAGAITQTYTPSIAMDSTSLCGITIEADADTFWVLDLDSTRLFQFELASGDELQTVQLWGNPGTLVQMAMYLPAGVTPPDEEEEDDDCPPLLEPLACVDPGATALQCGPRSRAALGCVAPDPDPLACGPRTRAVLGCVDGFTHSDLAITRLDTEA